MNNIEVKELITDFTIKNKSDLSISKQMQSSYKRNIMRILYAYGGWNLLYGSRKTKRRFRSVSKSDVEKNQNKQTLYTM